jgi:hypothetical protein
MAFQLRRSCILDPRHEPKIDQEIYLKPPSTSDFRFKVGDLPEMLPPNPFFWAGVECDLQIPQQYRGSKFDGVSLRNLENWNHSIQLFFELF